MRSAAPLQDVRIDPATQDDVAVLLRMINGLAEYERLAHLVLATEAGLRAALFGSRPVAESVIARAGEEAVGFAVFFPTFSTFAGRPGMYLEDLYVVPERRRRGVGGKLLSYVARAAADRGCDRVTWSVLDWNEPALAFYRGLGAEPVRDWVGYKIGGDAFNRLARSE